MDYYIFLQENNSTLSFSYKYINLFYYFFINYKDTIDESIKVIKYLQASIYESHDFIGIEFGFTRYPIF